VPPQSTQGEGTTTKLFYGNKRPGSRRPHVDANLGEPRAQLAEAMPFICEDEANSTHPLWDT